MTVVNDVDGGLCGFKINFIGARDRFVFRA